MRLHGGVSEGGGDDDCMVESVRVEVMRLHGGISEGGGDDDCMVESVRVEVMMTAWWSQ